MDWNRIYRDTALEDLHWYPGEPDEILRDAVAKGWLPGETALDLGCGQGTDTIYLAKMGYRAVGLDISSVACQVAKAEAQKCDIAMSLVAGDALKLPFGDGQFDVVSDRGCFHHIGSTDRDTWAREIGRVLKSDGRYFYRNFCWKARVNPTPDERLTEEAVRQTFEPYFTFEQFGEYIARGEGGRSSAKMHWALLVPQTRP